MFSKAQKFNSVSVIALISNVACAAPLMAQAVSPQTILLEAAELKIDVGSEGNSDERPAFFYHYTQNAPASFQGALSVGTAQGYYDLSLPGVSGQVYSSALRIGNGITAPIDFDGAISIYATRDAGTPGSNKSFETSGLHKRYSSGPLNEFTGTIAVTAQGADVTADGALVDITANGVNGTITGQNSGSIQTLVKGGIVKYASDTTNDSIQAKTRAVGVTNKILGGNSGKVSAIIQGGTITSRGLGSAEAYAQAFAVNNGVEGGNSGSIYAHITTAITTAEGAGGADSDGRVMGVFGGFDGTNSGEIVSSFVGRKATANGVGNASVGAEAHGVYGRFEGLNSGRIIVSGSGGIAVSNGGYAKAEADITGIDNRFIGENSGLIESYATGGTATTTGSGNADASALAVGIKGETYDPGNVSLSVINSGTIRVKAVAGAATASGTGNADGSASAYGVGSLQGTRYGFIGTFSNSGLIQVEAEAGTKNGTRDAAKAYGILLIGDTVLNNSGLIDVRATGASSIAKQVDADTHNLTINSYGIRFDDELNTQYAATINAEVAKVTFNDATLYAHNSAKTEVGKAYVVPDLVAGKDVKQFTKLNSDNVRGHGWSASIVDNTWATSDQAIIFNYAPQVSAPQLVASQQRGVIDATQRLSDRALEGLLSSQAGADRGGLLLSYAATPETEAQKAAADMAGVPHLPEQYGVYYAAPLHLTQSNTSNLSGYSARTTGLMTGYNRVVSSDLVVGGNVFYGHTAFDYDGVYETAKESVDTFGVGVQGAYRMGALAFSGQSTFYHTNNIYRDSAAYSQAKQNYTSQNLLSRVAAKYVWQQGNHTLAPEVGLSHLWHSRRGFTVDHATAPDVAYSSVSNHQLSVDASLGWTGSYQVHEGELKANLRAGLRQVLGNGGFKDVLHSGANGIASVSNASDSTLVRASASLDYTKNNFGVSLGVLGEYGETTRDTAFFGRVSYTF